MERILKGIPTLKKLCQSPNDGCCCAPRADGYWSDFVEQAVCDVWAWWSGHAESLHRSRRALLGLNENDGHHEAIVYTKDETLAIMGAGVGRGERGEFSAAFNRSFLRICKSLASSARY